MGDELVQKVEEMQNELARAENKRHHYKDEVAELELQNNDLTRKSQRLKSVLKTREESLVKLNSKIKSAEKHEAILNSDLRKLESAYADLVTKSTELEKKVYKTDEQSNILNLQLLSKDRNH